MSLTASKKGDNVQLKVIISRDVVRRLKVFVASKYPDLLRGPLNEEVEKALIQYLDMKGDSNKSKVGKDLSNTPTHQFQQHTQNNNNNNSSTKYNNLIEVIKRYSTLKNKYLQD